MQHRSVDVAIIGFGTAGMVARRNARQAGASVVAIDPGPLGTTCARVGCMPSKLLIAAADAANIVRDGALFGLHTKLEVDGPAVLQRVRRERDRFVGRVLPSVDEASKAGELIAGRARFLDPHTLAVDDHTQVRAKAIVIATGSSAFIPPPFRNLEDRLITSDQVFELSDLPESVLVAGAGAIGLELGQALHRLGVRVTVVSVDDMLGPIRDPQCREVALQAFSGQPEMFLSYTLQGIEHNTKEAIVRFLDAQGRAHERSVERVLVAAGRQPQLASLDLHRADIGYDGAHPPAVDPLTMQVGDTHVFIAGDVTGERPLLHEASDEGRIAGVNAARFPHVLANKRRTPIAIVFTDPQLAVVGNPFAQMTCDDNSVGEADYRAQGRALIMNEARGLVRIYGERGSGLLVGAEMVGPRVEHTAHLLAWAIQQRMTVSESLEMPFYHPVVEEGIRTALRALQTSLRVARPPGAECVEFGPGT